MIAFVVVPCVIAIPLCGSVVFNQEFCPWCGGARAPPRGPQDPTSLSPNSFLVSLLLLLFAGVLLTSASWPGRPGTVPQLDGGPVPERLCTALQPADLVMPERKITPRDYFSGPELTIQRLGLLLEGSFFFFLEI